MKRGFEVMQRGVWGVQRGIGVMRKGFGVMQGWFVAVGAAVRIWDGANGVCWCCNGDLG